MENNTDGNGLQRIIAYLDGLPPEGETLLYVRQKRAKGEHGDGTPKYVWIAHTDAAKIREGEAWYVNSGSFIIDRFADGKPHAGKDYCDRVALLLCDDVGTKSKMPPLEPTWKLETSPGNQQWVYVFGLDDQPRQAQYCAAIKSIAAAGYTDGGATNAVRNIRLPGSVNFKPGKDNFAARLVEFHPEREFTLPQICEAFGVSPDDTASAAHTSVQVVDTGEDDVLAWLSESGMVLEKANGSGWYGIVCPNAEQHSDGQPGARYLPATRAFCCYHEHCADLNSNAFLQWVAENGGPDHDAGLRDDILAKAMARLHEKLPKAAEQTVFKDTAGRVIAEAEQREIGRIQKADWYREFAYVMPDDGYFNMTTREELSRRAFDSIFRHIRCTTIHSEKASRVTPSISFDETRQEKGAKVLSGITYAPGETVLVSRNGQVFGNRWRDARPQIGADGGADVTPWLAHCRALVPDTAELDHILDVMAFKVQHPDVKINQAILMGGAPGCGKDTLFAPFIWAVCGAGLHNYALVDGERINSQWGYQYESEIFVLNELKEPEARERRALANRLKPIIAAPPDTLVVNRKGLAPYDAANRLLVLAFTNDFAPISIESDDRRWFCVWTHAPRMADGRAIWQWYENGGYEACAAWLRARDVSRFNPKGAAPMTDFKANMVESSLSSAESSIVAMIETGQSEFSRGVVASPWQGIADRISGQIAGNGGGVRVHPNAVLHALKSAGWIDCGRIMSARNTTKRHVFCKPELLRYTKSELRDMVEEPPAPLMKLVK